MLAGLGADAQSCSRPMPPYVPELTEDIRAYSDLLRRDMETYFTDVQQYFRRIDAERGEVLEEVRHATGGYGRMLEVTDL